MTEQELMDDPEEPTSVRRVRRKDRKRRLSSPGGLFPLEGETEKAEAPLPVETRSSMVVTPPQERFPPIPRVRRDIEKNVRPRATEQPPMAQRRRRRAARQNRVAFLFFLATALIGAYFVYIWLNPFSPLNLLAPPRPVLVVTATPMGMIALPFRLANPVVYSAGECEGLQINGTIRGREGESYAVRATSDTRDDGVIPMAQGSEYVFQFTLPREGDVYQVTLFDTSGEAIAPPVDIRVLDTCSATVRFEPEEG
jgi:uncharacterized membrane protein (DUF485 family)